MQSKGLDKFQIGIAYGMLPLLTVISGIFIGTLVDRFGIKKLISIAILGYFSFIILFSLSSNFIHFILSFVIVGLSNAMLWVSGRAFVLNLTNVAKSSSYFFTTVYITGILGPLIGGKLIENFGYGNLFIISPLIIFISLVFALLFFHEKRVKVKKKVRKQRIKWNLLLKIGIPIIVATIVTNLIFFLPIFLKIKNFGESEIGLIISSAALLITVFQIPAGRLISKLNIRTSMFIGFILIALGVFLLTTLSNTILQILFCLIPIAFGSSIEGIATFDALGRTSRQKGKVAGIYETIGNSGTWLGSIVNGFIFQAFGYNDLFLFLALISIFGSVLSLTIKVNRKEI